MTLETINYFGGRLSQTLSSDLEWLGLFEGEETLLCATGEAPGEYEKVTLRFGDRLLGDLGWQGLLSAGQAVETLAAQIACTWYEHPAAAMPIDRAIEQLYLQSERIDWCGVYRLRNRKLALSAFRGNRTEHVEIPLGNGICGAAVSENRTLNVGDVTSDPRHIACDWRTRSELVVPIRDGSGQAIAEIDVDSNQEGEFPEDIVATVERLAAELSPIVVELI